MKPELPPALTEVPPHGLPVWWAAIRPRTLSIAATPVLVGTALGVAQGATLAWAPLFATLACALLIQVGTNLHNDAADHERGNDRADRIGPLRVTAAGWVSARGVRRAAGVAFGGALLLGAYLVGVGGWPILAIGLASLLAGWSYSGGPRPISHTALGEVFVVVFFGIVAVLGSAWLQGAAGGGAALLAGVMVGLPAAAVLLVNNYRDLEADLRAGRRTLAAVLGRPLARRVYATLMLLPFVILPALPLIGHRGAWLGLVALLPAWHCVRALERSPIGPELNPLLAATARTGFALGMLLALGFLIG
jgi:1,4-dihydroxy-2-naphthoate polyprenyltransferase